MMQIFYNLSDPIYISAGLKNQTQDSSVCSRTSEDILCVK